METIKGYAVKVVQWECPNCGNYNSVDYSERQMCYCENCGKKVKVEV